MKIQTLVNFKLKNGNILRKGIYDDSEKPFPTEIYEEIKFSERTNKVALLRQKKIIVLEKTLKAVPIIEEKQVEVPEEVNTLETTEEVIETVKEEVVDKKRKRKK